ncbi:hypothetical protein HBB16_01210 [Pseudonocardia sp. MCCB 268]|nr:hypothetical protein [Pseudonocardia cytotoxica]
MRYGEDTTVTLVREDGGGERTTVPLEQLAEHVSEGGNPGNRAGLARAGGHPAPQAAAERLSSSTLPVSAGWGPRTGRDDASALPTADAVLLVSGRQPEYTARDRLLQAARKLCPNVARVVTKTDLFALAADRRASWTRPTWPAPGSTRRCCRCRRRCGCTRHAPDLDLIAESGFQALVGFLFRKVVSRADDLSRRSTSQDVLVICQALEATMRAEPMPAERPGEGRGALAKDLEYAKSCGRAAAAGRRAGRPR